MKKTSKQIKKILSLSLSLSLFIIFSNNKLSAQSSNLYIPLDIQKAYNNKTRSFDGRPGANYWQNRADYKIKVKFEPATGLVKGEEKATYFNNSPDTLKQIVIRLYQDLYKKGNMRDITVECADIHNGVDIEKLSINGVEIDINTEKLAAERTGTNLILKLHSPLYPKSSLSLNASWSFTLPKETDIRMGTCDESSYFVAFWYPQIAVYDDIDGWDMYDYTGTQEFYNDFGDFDVEITVPAGFIVWATGVLQNPHELLNKEYLEKCWRAQKSDDIIIIINEKDYKKNNIFIISSGAHTWKFSADNVSDFAFAVSDHHIWDGTSVKVDDDTGRRVAIYSAYKKESKDFGEVAELAKKTVEFLSTDLPGVAFPFPQITVFNGTRGKSGMEFPMLANNPTASERGRTVDVTAHEITHTYFPFYVGTNERKYAWMDEAWSAVIPAELQEKLEPTLNRITRYTKIYSQFSGKELDLPVMTPSVMLKGAPYYFTSYIRPGLAYIFLKDLLGDDLFKKALKEYINCWKHKHPLPYDFFFIFNDVVKEDLSWFWKPWFFEPGYPDLAIKKVIIKSKMCKIIIENKGNLPVPVALKYTFSDDTETLYYETAKIWKSGKKEITIKSSYQDKSLQIKKIELGNSQIPDVNIKDNIYYF